MALCYYKLDYYDISMEMLQIYLDKFNDSPIAVNLKACNHYRLYNSKAAENELKVLKSMSTSELNFAKDIILHNTVFLNLFFFFLKIFILFLLFN
jgi:intraflagellar transport protein 56